MTEHDQELSAMSAVVQALTPLDENARKRVLQYALARFKSTSPGVVADEVTEETEAAGGPPANGGAAKEIAGYGTLAELYHDAKPNSDAEKALVVSAWLQVSEARDGIDGFSVNSALKNLGYPIGNITRAFGVLVNQRPALMIQLRKAGVTRQARKLSKVTEAGLRHVREMLNSTAG
jgi:hypothetical protein